jgi:hypothetical protein
LAENVCGSLVQLIKFLKEYRNGRVTAREKEVLIVGVI